MNKKKLTKRIKQLQFSIEILEARIDLHNDYKKNPGLFHFLMNGGNDEMKKVTVDSVKESMKHIIEKDVKPFD